MEKKDEGGPSVKKRPGVDDGDYDDDSTSASGKSGDGETSRISARKLDYQDDGG